MFVSHSRITAKKFAIVHGARLVRKDAEFCRQLRKESKSALCRLPQCSLRCQIPPAGVSPGVRQEAQAQPIRGRVLSAASGRESHYTALPQACPPQSVSSPFFLLLPPGFWRPPPTTHQQPISSLGGPSLTFCTFLSAPRLSRLHPPMTLRVFFCLFFPVSPVSLALARIIPSFLLSEHPNFTR